MGSTRMIHDLDTQLTYLYEEEFFSAEQWGDNREDGGDDLFTEDGQDQDDDSVVGEETATVDEEIEDIIEELNTEQSEILDGYSCKYYLIRFIIVNIYFLHINTINIYK